MKKKGFTLIELLAVIVILAIIALISVPMIMNVIEKAKRGALEDSAYGMIEAANLYYSINGNNINDYALFEIANGDQISTNKLLYKGKVDTGKIYLYSTGKIALCIDNGTYYAKQALSDTKVTTGIGTCGSITETGDFVLISDITSLQNQVNTLQEQISNGKSLIAAAITNKGVATSDTDSFETMATNINSINTSSTFYSEMSGMSGSDTAGAFQIVRFTNVDVSNYSKLTVTSTGSCGFYGQVIADSVVLTSPTLPLNVSNYSKLTFAIIVRPNTPFAIKFE